MENARGQSSKGKEAIQMEQKKILDIKLTETGKINYAHKPDDSGCAGCMGCAGGTGCAGTGCIGQGVWKKCSGK